MASIRSGIGDNMEDRYLHKAKNAITGEWVTWNILSGLYGINFSPDTICQCTGLKDKNDRLIWENDIVRDGHGNFYKAFWQNNYYQFSWICVKSDVFSIGAKWDLWSFKSFEVEVIGNIFDNKELLESEEK